MNETPDKFSLMFGGSKMTPAVEAMRKECWSQISTCEDLVDRMLGAAKTLDALADNHRLPVEAVRYVADSMIKDSDALREWFLNACEMFQAKPEADPPPAE